MEKSNLIWFLTCAVVICSCQAESTELGHLKIELQNLARKDGALQNAVDNIWSTIIASGIRASNSNKTQNLTRMLEDLLANVSEEQIEIKHHFNKLDTETTRIDFSCKAAQAKSESMINELDERMAETEKSQGVINERVDKVLRDLGEKQNKFERKYHDLTISGIQTNDQQHKLNKIEAELTRKIGDVQQDYLNKQSNIEAVVQTLTQTVREVQAENINIKRELTELKASCVIPTPPTTPIAPQCEDGWKGFEGRCYLLVTSLRKIWADAATYCQARDSYLIEIYTDAEVEFVSFNLLRQSNQYFNFWVGASYQDNEGYFVYQHSNLRVPDKYWGPGEPNNYSEGYRCAAMYDFKYTAGKNVELRDHRCRSQRAFVCEK